MSKLAHAFLAEAPNSMQRGAQTHHLAIRGFGSPGTGVMKIAWEVRSGTDEIMGEWVSGEIRGEGLPSFISSPFEFAMPYEC